VIAIRNLQRRIPLDLPWLRRFAAVALDEAVAHSADGKFALRELDEVSVAIVSDRRIAQIHADFMGIAGPTDVITFEHGDIVISAETARAYSAEFAQPVDHEVALYILHGLLHLNGFDDIAARDRKRMHAVQARLFEKCLDRLSSRD
jgi:probable rRNA maturation factor